MSSNPHPASPLFHVQLLSPQQQQYLLLKSVQAECLLLLEAKPSSAAMIDQNEKHEILLQIVDNYVLQRSVDQTQIISAFACDYENQFEVVRKAAMVSNRLGEPEGIRFLLKKNPGQPINLAVRQQKKKDLQKFGRVLGRKFMVQLGFHACFKAIKKIGKGMTACVYAAINFATGEEVAIKSFKRSAYFQQDSGNGRISFLKEFKALTEVSHKNLCQLYSVYQTQNTTYVILELYPLSLYGYLQKFGFPSLEQAKAIMVNLLEGIAYLHEKGIMHRDLKLENIMVKKDGGKVIPVIVDLGLAEYTSAPKYLYTRCGTPGYVAPEVLGIRSTQPLQTYTQACDIFSLGVIFHILLFKKPLFEGKEVREVIRKNSECQIDFKNELFSSLDEMGRDIMMKMLCKDPEQRISAVQALNHPFLVDEKKKLELQTDYAFGTSYSIQP